MIWLNRKVYFKKVVLTLIPHNLEFIGTFEFIVREKKIIKLHEAEVPQYCLYLSTETGQYGTTVIVSKKDYVLARLGKSYGVCGVIKNIKHDDFILITKNTNPDKAIKQAVLKSWGVIFFIAMVLGLSLSFPLIIIFTLL